MLALDSATAKLPTTTETNRHAIMSNHNKDHKHKKSKKDKTQKDYGSNYGSIVENADTKTRASHSAPSEAASSFRHGTQHGGSQAPRSQAGASNSRSARPQAPADPIPQGCAFANTPRLPALQNYANGMRDVFTMDYSGRGRLNFSEGGDGLGVMANPFAMGGIMNTPPGGGNGQFPMMHGMTPYCPIYGRSDSMWDIGPWMGKYGCQDPWGNPM